MKKFYFLFIFLFFVLIVLFIVLFVVRKNRSVLSLSQFKENSSNVETGLKPVSTNNGNKEGEYNYNQKLNVGGNEILVEIADSEQKSIKGLSGREKLKNGFGMLFIYPTAQFVTFWMPQMNFPIDIVFIKENKIVEILDNVPNLPADYPMEKLPRYTSKEKVDMVLEVPAGWCGENEVSINNKVALP